jgi:hypothetical protein
MVIFIEYGMLFMALAVTLFIGKYIYEKIYSKGG